LGRSIPWDPKLVVEVLSPAGTVRARFSADLPADMELTESRSFEVLVAIAGGKKTFYGNPIDADPYHKSVEDGWGYLQANEGRLKSYWEKVWNASRHYFPVSIPQWTGGSGLYKTLRRGHRTNRDGTVRDDDVLRVAFRIADYTGLRPQDVMALWMKEGGLVTPNYFAFHRRWSSYIHVRASEAVTADFTRRFRARSRALAFWLGCGADLYNLEMGGGGADNYPELRLTHVDVGERHFKRIYGSFSHQVREPGLELLIPSSSVVARALHRGIGIRRGVQAAVTEGGPRVPAVRPIYSDTFTFLLVLSAALRFRQAGVFLNQTLGRGLEAWSRANNKILPTFWAELVYHGGRGGAKKLYNGRYAELPATPAPKVEDVYRKIGTMTRDHGFFTHGFYRYRAYWWFFDHWIKQLGWTRRRNLRGALPADDAFYSLDRPSP
jgi:hypothetical protein